MSIFLNALEFLKRLLAQSDPNAPAGWYSRGCMIGMITAIPLIFWLMSLNGGDDLSRRGWVLRACPPVKAISRAELLEHPQRFRNRFIWVTGQLQSTKKHCIKLPCQPGQTCCFPCRSRLQLGPSDSILLSGSTKSSKKELQRVLCLYTNCKKQCAPFSLGRYYAFAGKPDLQVKYDSHTQRPVFALRSFSVHRFCLLPGAAKADKKFQRTRKQRVPQYKKNKQSSSTR